jgi:hypothetical protein
MMVARDYTLAGYGYLIGAKGYISGRITKKPRQGRGVALYKTG